MSLVRLAVLIVALGSCSNIASAGGNVRITVQAPEGSAVPPYFPTAKPGLSFVSVVIRYDNGLPGNIQLFYEPWQMVGSDGVRHTAALPLRNDKLIAGSVVLTGGFLVGSLTSRFLPARSSSTT